MTEKYKRKIQGLSRLFRVYTIYPSCCYSGSFAEHFIKTHLDNYFAQDLLDFLNLHDYQQDRIGADLPWCGKKYFSDEDEPRVFVETTIVGDFEEVLSRLENDIGNSGISMKLVDESNYTSGNTNIAVRVYDKYFMRNGNRASLSQIDYHIRGRLLMNYDKSM